MNKREEAISRLVKYTEQQFKDGNNEYIIIKPKGAFKECRSFYAKMTKGRTSYALVILVAGIVNNNYDDIDLFHQHKQSCDLNEVIRYFVEVLDNVQFNKTTGQFSQCNCLMDYKEIMNDLWKLETDLECCVCKEPTLTQTPCGHTLCIPCWATIAHNNDKVDNDDDPECPMCRENIRCYFDD